LLHSNSYYSYCYEFSLPTALRICEFAKLIYP
jgi:hypothetical protein